MLVPDRSIAASLRHANGAVRFGAPLGGRRIAGRMQAPNNEVCV
jgi:hypothetical protein